MVNPQEAGGQTKPTNSDKLQALINQKWAAISQHVAQKLIDRRVNTANIDSLHQLHLIVNKSL